MVPSHVSAPRGYVTYSCLAPSPHELRPLLVDPAAALPATETAPSRPLPVDPAAALPATETPPSRPLPVDPAASPPPCSRPSAAVVLLAAETAPLLPHRFLPPSSLLAKLAC